MRPTQVHGDCVTSGHNGAELAVKMRTAKLPHARGTNRWGKGIDGPKCVVVSSYSANARPASGDRGDDMWALRRMFLLPKLAPSR